MSDKVKLIIEISKEDLKRISDGEWIGTYIYNNMILNGTPLDDVKAEIEKLDEGITSYVHDNPWVYKSEVMQILDNIGKAESEDKK